MRLLRRHPGIRVGLGWPLLFFAAGLVAVQAAAQQCGPAPAGGTAERKQDNHKRDMRAAVEATDERWRLAQSTNDVEAMDKLLSADYLGISGNGQVLTKTQQLDRMRSRQTNITKLDVTDEKVKIIGAAAIVTSLATLEGTMDGRPLHGPFRSTRVYQRMPNGVWQITSFEATPLRGPLAEGPGSAR